MAVTAGPFKSLYGSKEREQEVLTPDLILDAIRQVWPEGIALDPSGSDMFQFADTTWTKHGLLYGWADRTFSNPPFADLEEWLKKAATEGLWGKETMMLMPARTHRAWFWQNWSAIAWLKQIAFKGNKDTFPQPLALAYWGNRCYTFRTAMDTLSTKVDACNPR